MTILYSKQGCSPCMLVKRLFDSKKVEYEVRDISEDRWRDELQEKYQVQMVPVTVFGDDFVVGLNVSEIMKKLSNLV